MPKVYPECEATKFNDMRQMKVVRLSVQQNGSIYTPVDIPINQFCYRLSRPEGQSVAGRNISMKISKNIIGNRTRDLPGRSAVPQPTAAPCALIINSVLSKLCSIWCYSNFGTLFKFLFSTFRVMNDFVFTFFPWIMTRSLIGFIIREGSEWCAKDKNRQITEFWRGRQCLISRPHFKNGGEFLCNTFSSLQK